MLLFGEKIPLSAFLRHFTYKTNSHSEEVSIEQWSAKKKISSGFLACWLRAFTQHILKWDWSWFARSLVMVQNFWSANLAKKIKYRIFWMMQRAGRTIAAFSLTWSKIVMLEAGKLQKMVELLDFFFFFGCIAVWILIRIWQVNVLKILYS